MYSEGRGITPEHLKPISQEVPLSEVLLDPSRLSEILPPELANDPTLREQIQERKNLNERLDVVVEKLPKPDLSLEEAIQQGHVNEQEVAELYDALSGTLENPDYKRLALYLPFEFLPDKKWQPKEEQLQSAKERFSHAYILAWADLMSVQDVRASFVDGDILESENRDGEVPRVVKAAHLLPWLVEKGMLDFDDVLELIEKNSDPVLRRSVADTIPVLADRGFVNEREIHRMEYSGDDLVSDLAQEITKTGGALQSEQKMPTREITVASIEQELAKKFSEIEAADYGDITEKRKKWLMQEKKKEVVERLASDLVLARERGTFNREAIEALLHSESTDAQQVAIEGVRQGVEAQSLDMESAQAVYAEHRETLLQLLGEKNLHTQDTLEKMFRRFERLGIVEQGELARLDIPMPKLAGPFSENLRLIEGKMQEIREMVGGIEKDEELKEYVFPAAVVSGSLLKGYAGATVDFDLSVFVKPGIPHEKFEEIHKLLTTVFPPERIQGEVIQFWLEEKQEGFVVQDLDSENMIQGASTWSQLFGGAWVGEGHAIKALREKILPNYLRETDRKIRGRESHAVYLDEIERDVLVYRLLHKGYERFYPPVGGVHTPHADKIDGKSVFWDSGYRQLATQLFARKVFLPKVPRAEVGSGS